MRDLTTEGGGNPEDLGDLVREHLPLVRHVVTALAGRLPRHVRADELSSAGLLGLAQAARTYDPARGVPFSRHATNRIRGAILDELRSMDWASRSVRVRARQIDGAVDQLATRLRRSPTVDEIAGELRISADEVTAMRSDVERATVVYYETLAATDEADGALPAEHRTPESVLVDREQESYLRDAVRTLPERLRIVVEGYFFDERPMQELAEELGVTESRISQMRAEALTLIGDSLRYVLDGRLPTGAEEKGRAAARRAAYCDAVAAASQFRDRFEPSSREVAMGGRRRP